MSAVRRARAPQEICKLASALQTRNSTAQHRNNLKSKRAQVTGSLGNSAFACFTLPTRAVTLAASARRDACAAALVERADSAAGAAEAACTATSAVFTAADCADASAVSTAWARLNVASRSVAATVAAFDADCDAAVVITRADVSAALAAAASDANLAAAAASATGARAVLRRLRPSVGDVCAAAARAFTSIARDRMLSLRDSFAA